MAVRGHFAWESVVRLASVIAAGSVFAPVKDQTGAAITGDVRSYLCSSGIYGVLVGGQDVLTGGTAPDC